MSPIHTDIVHSHHYPMVFSWNRDTWTLFTVTIVHSQYLVVLLCHQNTRIFSQPLHHGLPMSPIYTHIVHYHNYPVVFAWNRNTRALFTAIMVFPCHRYTRILFTIIIIPWSSHATEIHAHCSQPVHHGLLMSPIYTHIVHNHNYPVVFAWNRNTRALSTASTSWSSHAT